MKAGRLNKTELARMVRSYRDIQGLLDKLPLTTNLDRTEQSTADCLFKARNGLGELLRWQDFGGAWQEAQKKTNETQ